MLMKGNRSRALKGFIYCGLISSRTLYIVASSVIFGVVALTTVLNVITISEGHTSHNSGGTLVQGFGTAAISMFVTAIISALKSTMKADFVFPIDRMTYTIGNLILFAINSFVLLVLTSASFVLEFAVNKALSSITGAIRYINAVTPSSFVDGFVVSLFYLLLISALTYLVFMLFARFRLIGVAVFFLATGAMFSFPVGREALYSILMFFVGEQSVVLLVCKLLLATLALMGLSLLPLKKLEVNT